MSNPTILVEPFTNSLGAFVGVDPIRFWDGLLLEEAGTNALKNPIAAATANNWNVFANRTVTRVATLPGPMPEPYTDLVTTGLLLASAGALSNTAATNHEGLVMSAAEWMQTGFLWIPASWTGGTVRFTMADLTSATGITAVAANMSLRDQWQQVTMGPFTPAGGDTIGTYTISVLGNYNNGESFYFTLGGVMPGDYLTTIPVGSFGDGFTWAGTANNSASNRDASSAAVTMDEPVSVACWYREAYSGAKQFAYLDTLGQLGDYGDISWAAGDLTISTTRNLVIGPFAAFDRELTGAERANLSRTQNWNMYTVIGRGRYSFFQLRP